MFVTYIELLYGSCVLQTAINKSIWHGLHTIQMYYERKISIECYLHIMDGNG